jgi:hypothetical protein
MFFLTHAHALILLLTLKKIDNAKQIHPSHFSPHVSGDDRIGAIISSLKVHGRDSLNHPSPSN